MGKSATYLNYNFTVSEDKIVHDYWVTIGHFGQSEVIPVEELRSSSTEKVKRMST